MFNWRYSLANFKALSDFLLTTVTIYWSKGWVLFAVSAPPPLLYYSKTSRQMDRQRDRWVGRQVDTKRQTGMCANYIHVHVPTSTYTYLHVHVGLTNKFSSGLQLLTLQCFLWYQERSNVLFWSTTLLFMPLDTHCLDTGAHTQICQICRWVEQMFKESKWPPSLRLP